MTDFSTVVDDLQVLRQQMRKVQEEVAALRHPLAAEDRIMAATMELDAIVLATEAATNNILQTAEQIGGACDEIAAIAQDEDVTQCLDRIGLLVADLFTHCAFQDITGQRVAKVILTLQFVEERIQAIIEQWGEENFARLPPPGDRTGEAALLNGPQLDKRGVSQTDIDALFS